MRRCCQSAIISGACHPLDIYSCWSAKVCEDGRGAYGCTPALTPSAWAFGDDPTHPHRRNLYAH